MYLDSQKIGPFRVGPVSRLFITKTVSKLRLWDYYSTKGVDEFIAISQYIQKRISKYYHRDSKLVYPPVDLSLFKTNPTLKKQSYFVIVSVLSQYKNIELAINAFKINKLKLIIVGDGPDRERLEAIARSANNISFLGRVSNNKKAELLAQARAFIFCSVEDFGIAPIEALAAGTPVIAPNIGGLSETITNRKTGILFQNLDVKDLNDAISAFSKSTFSTKTLVTAAEKYSSDSFKNNFRKTVDSIVRAKA